MGKYSVSSHFFQPYRSYFFQTEKTDPGFRRWFARLRNSETTGILKTEISFHPNINQGIFIDIFPLDSVPSNTDDYQQQIKKHDYYRNKYYRFLKIETNLRSKEVPQYKRLAISIAHYLLGTTIKILGLTKWAHKKCDEVIQLYNMENTEFVSLMSFQIRNLEHAIRRTDMKNIIYMDFEFLKMPVIANYDEHLKRKYGNYMTPVRNPNFHGDVIWDTNIDYPNIRSKKDHIKCKCLYMKS